MEEAGNNSAKRKRKLMGKVRAGNLEAFTTYVSTKSISRKSGEEVWKSWRNGIGSEIKPSSATVCYH